ncbi:MAG: transketolase C-terminal domain-containing protein [Candidatus Kryptoniota bacterium]
MATFRIRSGNQMIAEGAIAAGCRFFAGYPITPASGIYKKMIDELSARGDVAISSPDEITALAYVVGASQRGFKAMTATSGPGFSLMVETLQFAVMTETPLVIAFVQRPGPSTGGATQGGQGDVLFVGHSIGGGYTIPVFCPSTPIEAYELTIHSFNVSEKLRTPVVLLTDKEVGMTSENVDYEGLPTCQVTPRNLYASNNGGNFRSYDFKALEDVPPFAPVGGKVKVTVTGSAHDKSGRLQKNSLETIDVLRHLQKKIEGHAQEIITLGTDLQAGSDIVILSYGITARTAKEAVRRIRASGRKVSLINLKTLYPVPENQLLELTKEMHRVVIAEENIMGLYKQEIERLFPGKEIIRVNAVGRMITPGEIEQAILNSEL